jgi:hypothetical protein
LSACSPLSLAGSFMVFFSKSVSDIRIHQAELMNLISEMGLSESQFRVLVEDYHDIPECDQGIREFGLSLDEYSALWDKGCVL